MPDPQLLRTSTEHNKSPPPSPREFLQESSSSIQEKSPFTRPSVLTSPSLMTSSSMLSTLSFKVRTEAEGEKVLSQEEISALVRNSMHRARQAKQAAPATSPEKRAQASMNMPPMSSTRTSKATPRVAPELPQEHETPHVDPMDDGMSGAFTWSYEEGASSDNSAEARPDPSVAASSSATQTDSEDSSSGGTSSKEAESTEASRGSSSSASEGGSFTSKHSIANNVVVATVKSVDVIENILPDISKPVENPELVGDGVKATHVTETEEVQQSSTQPVLSSRESPKAPQNIDESMVLSTKDKLPDSVENSVQRAEDSARQEIEGLLEASKSKTGEIEIKTESGEMRVMSQVEIDNLVMYAVDKARETAQQQISELVETSMRDARESAREEIREMVRESMRTARESSEDSFRASARVSIRELATGSPTSPIQTTRSTSESRSPTRLRQMSPRRQRHFEQQMSVRSPQRADIFTIDSSKRTVASNSPKRATSFTSDSPKTYPPLLLPRNAFIETQDSADSSTISLPAAPSPEVASPSISKVTPPVNVSKDTPPASVAELDSLASVSEVASSSSVSEVASPSSAFKIASPVITPKAISPAIAFKIGSLAGTSKVTSPASAFKIALSSPWEVGRSVEANTGMENLLQIDTGLDIDSTKLTPDQNEDDGDKHAVEAAGVITDFGEMSPSYEYSAELRRQEAEKNKEDEKPKAQTRAQRLANRRASRSFMSNSGQFGEEESVEDAKDAISVAANSCLSDSEPVVLIADGKRITTGENLTKAVNHLKNLEKERTLFQPIIKTGTETITETKEKTEATQIPTSAVGPDPEKQIEATVRSIQVTSIADLSPLANASVLAASAFSGYFSSGERQLDTPKRLPVDVTDISQLPVSPWGLDPQITIAEKALEIQTTPYETTVAKDSKPKSRDIARLKRGGKPDLVLQQRLHSSPLAATASPQDELERKLALMRKKPTSASVIAAMSSSMDESEEKRPRSSRARKTRAKRSAMKKSSPSPKIDTGVFIGSKPATKSLSAAAQQKRFEETLVTDELISRIAALKGSKLTAEELSRLVEATTARNDRSSSATTAASAFGVLPKFQGLEAAFCTNLLDQIWPLNEEEGEYDDETIEALGRQVQSSGTSFFDSVVDYNDVQTTTYEEYSETDVSFSLSIGPDVLSYSFSRGRRSDISVSTSAEESESATEVEVEVEIEETSSEGDTSYSPGWWRK